MMILLEIVWQDVSELPERTKVSDIAKGQELSCNAHTERVDIIHVVTLVKFSVNL